MSQAVRCTQCGVSHDTPHKFCPACGAALAPGAKSVDDPLIGRTLPGGHVVLELIDVGGMGRVYRAEQKVLGRTVAVKIIHPHLLGDPTVEARFVTEARAASQLNHPNSVGIIDFGSIDGRFYMVMEYLRGRDLATVAHEDAPIGCERIIDILRQILAALEEAHHHGIIHRDLKPENIVLEALRSGGDFVKVLDFGLAKVREAAQLKRITNPGMVCGTPEYMAPEQARGDAVDARTDLYACGVILYELLTAHLPFEATSPSQVVLMHLSAVPPDPRTVVPDRGIPEALARVTLKALAKNPSERFQSATEFATALRDSLERESRPRGARRCAHCGSTAPPTQKFCGDCGAPLQKRPASRSSAPPSSDREEPPQLPLRGREPDLGWLHACRSQVRTGLSACRVVGPAGVGKTRLLEEFLVGLEDAGDVVVSVGPDPWRAEVGFHALRRAIEGLASLPVGGGEPSRWHGASSDARAGLQAVFAADAEVRQTARRRWWLEAPPGGATRSGKRSLVAEALRWALQEARRAHDDACVVLACDDLDAVDGASRNAIADIVAEPPLGSVLIVGAHASGFDPGWEGDSQRLLRGLRVGEVQGLVQADARGARETLGLGAMSLVLPMYVEQLIRFAREGGADAPPGIADLVSLRIERLPAESRRVLQAVAVLGEDATYDALREMVPDVESCERRVTELVRGGFLLRTADGAGPAHPLVRELTLAAAPAEVRRGLHAQARRTSGPSGAPVPIEAEALHAYHSRDSFEALMLLEQVAERAKARGDLGGSVRALHLGLDLARRELSRGELDDPLAAVLIFSCKLGDALSLAGKYHDAEGVLAEALSLAGPNARERPRILASLANAAYGAGRLDAAASLCDEAVALANRGRSTEFLAALEQMRRDWTEWTVA